MSASAKNDIWILSVCLQNDFELYKPLEGFSSIILNMPIHGWSPTILKVVFDWPHGIIVVLNQRKSTAWVYDFMEFIPFAMYVSPVRYRYQNMIFTETIHNVWKTLSAVERLPRKCNWITSKSQRWKRLSRCNPCLWGWKANWGSQGGAICYKSIFPGLAEKE